jgi:hypothetical protein
MARLRAASDADVAPAAEPMSTDASNDGDSQAGQCLSPAGEGEEGEGEFEEEPRVGKVEKPLTRGRKHMRGFRYQAQPSTRQARRRTPKVLVVGGGFAGVAAAARLQNEYGYQVLLLEARDRLGGRCHSLVDESGVTVELGAAVLMGVQGGNPLATLCRRLGVRMHRLEPKCPIYDAELGGALPPDLDRRVEALFNEALEAASAAARAPHASSLFVYDRAELEIEVAGKWRQATVLRRGGGAGGGEAAGGAERALVRYCLAAQQPSPSAREASPTPAPAPAAPAAALSRPARASAAGRRAPASGGGAAAEAWVEEWVGLPSARLRPPALESSLAGALRARLGAAAEGAQAGGAAGAEGGEGAQAGGAGGESEPVDGWLGGGAAGRALQWHLANLEFACAASLSCVSAAEWDQVGGGEAGGKGKRVWDQVGEVRLQGRGSGCGIRWGR